VTLTNLVRIGKLFPIILILGNDGVKFNKPNLCLYIFTLSLSLFFCYLMYFLSDQTLDVVDHLVIYGFSFLIAYFLTEDLKIIEMENDKK